MTVKIRQQSIRDNNQGGKLTDDKSVRVTKHSYSSSIDCCDSDPVLFPLFERRNIQAVLATVHCPVLHQVLLRLHTPHLKKRQLDSWETWFLPKLFPNIHFSYYSVIKNYAQTIVFCLVNSTRDIEKNKRLLNCECTSACFCNKVFVFLTFFNST